MNVIEGLTYIDSFIDENQSVQLWEFIHEQQWSNILNRRTQHFNFEYEYKTQTLNNKCDVIPDIFYTLVIQPLQQQGYFQDVDRSHFQIIINEYCPGQSIGPHTDHVKLFGPTIVSLSLGAQCDMNFSWGNEKASVPLKPNSVVILEGPARYKWRHAIKTSKQTMKSNRVSLTIRSVIVEKA